MKATLFSILLFSTLLEGAEALNLASDRWPPFTDTFQETRFALDIVHLALLRSGIEAETEILDQWTLPADLKTKQYDGSGALWKNAERETFLLFSKPYLENRLLLIGRKGLDVSSNNLSELSNKRLALVRGYDYGDLLKNTADVKIIYGTSDIENIQNVIRGQSDYALVESLVVQHMAKEHKTKAEEHLSIGNEPLLIQPLYFALRKEVKNAHSIIDRFNTEIRIMQADGTYNRILRLSWIRVDIDQDGRTELVQGGQAIGPDAPVSAYDIAYTAQKLESVEKRERYWINGQFYDDWNQVQASDTRTELKANAPEDSLLLFESTF
ncbi:MAG: substrate-binding periplasmic protein [Coraliomargaritaceae bacterium]